MSSEYSIDVQDWNDYEKWENEGQSAVREAMRKELEKKYPKSDTDSYDDEGVQELWDKYSYSEDANVPMMNYAYPLYGCPDDENIVKICVETSLTVMKNLETNEYFLALCGGGMDLSQSICYAYILAGQRIPAALAYATCTQPELSVGKKAWRIVKKACEESLRNDASSYLHKADEFKKALGSEKAYFNARRKKYKV